VRLQFGTVQGQVVIDQLKRWLPGRAAAIQKIADDARLGVEIELRSIKPAHSDSQRGLYWSALHEFGAWCGYSKREVENQLHDIICTEAFGQAGIRQFEIGGRVIEWPVPAERSSKDMTGRRREREQYGHLIDTLIRVAGEHGFAISDRRERRCG
jgi:hypothetical protein